jgi:hypothetical protein
MNRTGLALVGSLALLATPGFIAAGNAESKDVPANKALTGVTLAMSPDQLPDQFRTQLGGDVKSSRGTAVLKKVGNDVKYKFTWRNLSSNVISGHFHSAPHGQVGVRAYSICGVSGESPPCPKGRSGSISGVWKNADLAAFNEGRVTVAFHTEAHPAPAGEIAAYIAASK